MVFPDSSVGEEYPCNAGDPGLIPGSGRSAGEGIGCPLQFSWASLVTQLVKNLPVMRETWVGSLVSWEDPLEKGMATHSNILARRILAWDPWGHKELDTTERLSLSHIIFTILTILKCISVALSTFILLCNHYHHPSPQLFHHFN